MSTAYPNMSYLQLCNYQKREDDLIYVQVKRDEKPYYRFGLISKSMLNDLDALYALAIENKNAELLNEQNYKAYFNKQRQLIWKQTS